MYRYKRRRYRSREKSLYVRMMIDGKRKWIKGGTLDTRSQYIWWDYEKDDPDWRRLFVWGEEPSS